jgi:nitrogen fixation protein NifB
MLKLQVASRAGVGASAEGCASSGCGGSSAGLSHLPKHIRAKVHNHPCYSEEAHHHYARMHVAVAPACNIQCHYCNRKYNCANESRPGVVSELLTPAQAVKQVLAVAATIPQMAVLGIAGPGDPLANPERTLATFRALADQAPDIKLCVSTNGLALPDLVEDLCALNIDHVTLTINCVDPEVGAQIYPWIFWKNRRIKGRKAAEILIERQQRGLEMLVARGVLVKVNSVLIPGVNDEHLKEVSRLVKAKGAFLQLQDACAGDMAMMRHCRQCRADAVGMLGEDRGAEFSLDKIETLEIDYPQAMARRRQVHAAIEARRAAVGQPPAKGEILISPTAIKRARRETRPVLMAVATSGGGLINQHFGQAREFLVYQASAQEVRFIGVRKVGAYCSGPEDCGELDWVLEDTLRALSGCEAVLCSRIGFEPWGQLEAAGITPNGEHAQEPIEQAVASLYQEWVAAGRVAMHSPELARQRA